MSHPPMTATRINALAHASHRAGRHYATEVLAMMAEAADELADEHGDNNGKYALRCQIDAAIVTLQAAREAARG